jgi:hypothetical protein
MKCRGWFLVLALALLAVTVRGESPSKVKAGILHNLEANCQACNEENLDKLLATMSDEMPNRDLFIETTLAGWRELDTYNRIDKVEVLKHSDAPHANCRYPYATALVTQTIIKVGDGQASVFKQCEDGECYDKDLAHKMNVDPKFETARMQMLFKHEDGEWKLIAGLTDPEPVGLVGRSAGKPSGRTAGKRTGQSQ